MAGRVVVSTLNDDTGVLATQNGMTGIAKAWVFFNGTTNTINGSFNVSSTTKNGTGDWTINYTTAMPNANYVGVGMNGGASTQSMVSGENGGSLRTTSAIRVYSLNTAGGLVDSAYVGVAVFSS